VSNDSGFVDPDGRHIDFGRTAVDYERYRPGFPDSFFDRLLAVGWITPQDRALDLGTGTGSMAIGLAARGLDVVGLDLAPELLAVARRTADRRGLEIGFEEGRAEATGYHAASFDLVTAGQCWWWFDAADTLAEAKRILLPGGRLLICAFSYLPISANVAERTEALILEFNQDWPKAGWRGVHPEQIEALDQAGFRRVESFSYTVDVPFTHEGWRGRIRTCNGVGSSLLPDQVARFDAALAELLRTEFPGTLCVPHRVFAVSGLSPSGSES
jgi:SAM-dependent methyltransferase